MIKLDVGDYIIFEKHCESYKAKILEINITDHPRLYDYYTIKGEDGRVEMMTFESLEALGVVKLCSRPDKI